MSLEYTGKRINLKCLVCKETKTSTFYGWYTIFSPEPTTCCHKCALREYGKTYVNKIKQTGEANGLP